MQISRRQLGFGLGSMAFAGLAARCWAQAPVPGMNEVQGYGALVRDPNNLIDLPKGFSYRVISRLGNIMDDGFLVPNSADGMGAFDFGKGKVALVRNHELSVGDSGVVGSSRLSSPTAPPAATATGVGSGEWTRCLVATAVPP